MRFSALRAALVVAVVGCVGAATPALAEADGPDYFRVIGVSAGNVLNVRAEATSKSAVVGRIPAGADGLRNMGCQGGLTLEQFSSATDAEKEAARFTRWCKVGFEGKEGWVAGWHVGEGAGPELTQTETAKPVASDAALVGAKWWLTELGGKPAVGNAFVNFAADGAVNGNAGCNNFMGSAAQGEGSIKFKPLGSTMMMCTEDGLSEQEGALHQVLVDETSYTIAGDVLTITNTASGTKAVFSKTEPKS
jgi:heat shock protein HslJ